MSRHRHYLRSFILTAAGLSLSACGPNYGPIAARRLDQIVKLENQNSLLEARLKDSNATIAALRAQLAGQTPRVQTLPPDRLDQLVTADRIELPKSTDAADFDGDGKQDGFRVYFRPVSEDGQPIPATGATTIEAFDLALEQGSQRIGKWTFEPKQLKQNWYSGFGLNHFAVNCPWSAPPQHDQITFKITFTDALTGRVMTDQALVHIHLKPGPK